MSRELGGKKGEKYSEVSKEEMTKRFNELLSLFTDESAFLDFLNNAHNYPDEFKMVDKDGIDLSRDQKSSFFRQAHGLVKLVESAIRFYQKKQNEGSVNNNDYNSLQMAKEEAGQPEAQLDVDKLTRAMKWSIDAFAKGGEKIGRMPKELEVKNGERMVADLGEILEKVNQYT